MKNQLPYFFVSLSIFFFLSCNTNGTLTNGIRTLDSLDGALGALSKEVSSVDSAELDKVLERFSTYKFFIQTQIKDTLFPKEAEQLKRFFQSASTLESYRKNRQAILSRADLLNKQIQLLRHDVSERVSSDEILISYIENEKSEVEHLTMLMIREQKAYYSAIMTHKMSLADVENFIRFHNHGELPVLLKEENN